MKKLIFIISILLIFTSCDDKPNVVDKPLYEGMFDGNIGRHQFVQTNSKDRNVITQKGNFSNLEIEINLDGSGGQGNEKFIIYNQLNIILKDISKGKLYLDFDQNNGSKSPENNKIILLVKEQFNSSIKSEEYICIPDKKKFTIAIIDLGDNNNQFIKGTINGYLFNINNTKDSILITANFITD